MPLYITENKLFSVIEAIAPDTQKEVLAMSASRQDPESSNGDDEVIEGQVMTEAERDRMNILSWWHSYTYRDRSEG